MPSTYIGVFEVQSCTSKLDFPIVTQYSRVADIVEKKKEAFDDLFWSVAYYIEGHTITVNSGQSKVKQ